MTIVYKSGEQENHTKEGRCVKFFLFEVKSKPPTRTTKKLSLRYSGGTIIGI